MRGTTRKDRKRCENFPRKYSIRRRMDNRKPWSPTVGGDVTRDSRDGPSVPERDDAAPLEMSEETARTVLAHLKRRSRTLRIAPEDREDLVQDVTIWVASHREAISGSTPNQPALRAGHRRRSRNSRGSSGRGKKGSSSSFSKVTDGSPPSIVSGSVTAAGPGGARGFAGASRK